QRDLELLGEVRLALLEVVPRPGGLAVLHAHLVRLPEEPHEVGLRRRAVPDGLAARGGEIAASREDRRAGDGPEGDGEEQRDQAWHGVLPGVAGPAGTLPHGEHGLTAFLPLARVD